MRITRAAKVAAFPLLALVLVVALIACTGPVGPPGEDATPVPGTPGTDAPPGLHAAVLRAQVLNVGTKADTKTLDMSTAFTGGTPKGRTYRIVSNVNAWTGLSFSLKDSKLELKASANTAAAPEDAVIWIEAMDTDDRTAVAHVSVRANDAVAVTGNTPGLIVGTQADDSRTRAGQKMPDYHDVATITCPKMNTCNVKLTADDDNLRDSLAWKFLVTAPGEIKDANGKVVSASVDNVDGSRLDGVVIITGLKVGEATVRVWAIDEGGVPKNAEDDKSTEDEDESRPFPASFHTITVTVDAAPTLSEDAIEAVTMDIGQTEIVGTVFDLDGEELIDKITVTPAYPSAQRNVEVVWDSADSNIAGGRALHVIGRNSGTVSITVRVSEPTANNAPDQYVEHTFIATVTQERN